jgi:hypothetical protein
LASSLGKYTKALPSHFVKKLNEIPEFPLPSTTSYQMALKLVERQMIGEFIKVWPSPRVIEVWIEKN